MLTSAAAMREKALEHAPDYGPLVEALAEDLKNLGFSDIDDIAAKVDATDMESLRVGTRQLVADAVAAVKDMPGAEGYGRWVLDVARAAAAAKTGGFLGFGAKSVVDEREEAALAELRAILEG